MDYFDCNAGIAVDSREVSTIANFIKTLSSDRSYWESYAMSALAIAESHSAAVYRERANSFISNVIPKHINLSS